MAHEVKFTQRSLVSGDIIALTYSITLAEV